MFLLLTLVPWVLTVGALFFIIYRQQRNDDDYYHHLHDDDDLEDLIMEENMEIVRVAVYEDKAYWVHNNVFYESEITREPDWETARPIDTSKLSNKEMSKLLKVLDDLKDSEEG